MRLAAEDLAIGYPGRPVGRGISLTVTGGETLALLGPNGSGKTTLFKTLLGLLPAREGRVTLDGTDIRHLSRRELACSLGYVPQAGSGYFPYTALELVLMGRTARLGPFAAPGPRDRTVALEALDRLQVAPLAHRVFTRLSGGQRQLVLIARALAQEPRLLVMDEPTASLDFGNQLRVLEHVRRLAGDGIGVVLSSHDPGQALAVAGRAALLHEGGLLALGPARQVIDRDSLRRLYGVEVDLVELPDGRRVCVPARQG